MCGRRRGGKGDHVAELVAAGYPELGIGPVQVRVDGARREEQPVGDLAVSQAVAGQQDDLPLLGGELGQGIGFAGCPAMATPQALSSA
jgi:hypothetical protein